MKINQLLGKRYKEKPSDTKLKSHELLIRGGYVRPVFSGIFSSLLPGLKVLKNIEAIVREEMNNIDGQEVEMPLVQPKELWEESGRYFAINDELARFKDRNEHDMVLAMTHEETAVALARTEATSYKDYPFTIYQFAKKFRDEARPRGGLIRVKEFTMKDAYSFHTSQEDLEGYYARAAIAYSRIFARAGIPEVIAIKSDSGMMGGKVAHEYMLLTSSGEDTIITCSDCDYKANKEVANSKITVVNENDTEKPLEKIYTPNAETIEEVSKLLKMPSNRFAKTVVYKPVDGDKRTIVVMIRGDRDVNESKLSKILQAMPEFADDIAFDNSGVVPGYASGYKLKNARVIVDEGLTLEKNLVTGANEEGYHFANFNIKRDIPTAELFDLVSVQDGDLCQKCGSPIKVHRGIEVGNIFQLGDKYTKSMKMSYMDENTKIQTPIMGCYGIGIGRLMASVVEARYDERGPIWPVSIAPWKVSIVALAGKSEDKTIENQANDLYKQMQKEGIEVILDDRNTSAGEKFADIDLLGVPLQFVISQRTLEQGSAEWKVRSTGEKGMVKIDQVVSMAKNWLKAENEKIMTVANGLKGLPIDEIVSLKKNLIDKKIADRLNDFLK